MAECSAEHFRCGKLHAPVRALIRRRHGARHGIGIEQRLRQCHAALAIKRRVMHFAIERDFAVLQTLDHIKLPQRLIAIKQRRVQFSDTRLKLRLRTRLGQGERTDVIVKINVILVQPNRVGQIEGHEHQLARKQRRQMQARLDMVAEVG